MPPDLPIPANKRGKIAPVKLAHVVLRTGDAKRLVQWYRTVLEAETALANGLQHFLTYDEEHHRIAIAQLPGVDHAPDRVTTGLEHFAFTYASADDLFATYERLKRESITPYWTINHGPTLSMYYRDPDGNQVELQIDLFDTVEATNAWFAQSDFAMNPIGVKFDPDDLIQRYRSGEAPERLFSRPIIDASRVVSQFL